MCIVYHTSNLVNFANYFATIQNLQPVEFAIFLVMDVEVTSQAAKLISCVCFIRIKSGSTKYDSRCA